MLHVWVQIMPTLLQIHNWLQSIHEDFLKKLVSGDCLTPLLFMSVCVFLELFLTSDGRYSRDTGGLIIIWGSSSLASQC